LELSIHGSKEIFNIHNVLMYLAGAELDGGYTIGIVKSGPSVDATDVILQRIDGWSNSGAVWLCDVFEEFD